MKVYVAIQCYEPQLPRLGNKVVLGIFQTYGGAVDFVDCSNLPHVTIEEHEVIE